MNKAAIKIVDALKQSPLLLTLLLINVLIVFGLLYMLREVAAATKADRDVRNALLTQCMQGRGGN